MTKETDADRRTFLGGSWFSNVPLGVHARSFGSFVPPDHSSDLSFRTSLPARMKR